MSDIILVSGLATPSHRVLQALESAGLQTVDLLTLDAFEIHRRTQLSVIDVQNLVRDVIAALARTTEVKHTQTAEERNREFAFLTTGDEGINKLLKGGIPTGSLTEITGERLYDIDKHSANFSGLGKSQLCLQLCIHVQLPRSLGGLDAGAIYLGTESSLATIRLSQIAESLTTTFSTAPPSHISATDVTTALSALATHGDRILYFYCRDLEEQEHIISYQLPVVLSRHRIGLIILDSVTAHYRAEFDRQTSLPQKGSPQLAQMVQRSRDLRKLGGILKDLAVEWNVAVVAVNQVTDAFKRSSSQSSQEKELLALDYQAKWFDGLIDESGVEGTKRPALGLVWSNLITSRIMLVKDVNGQTRIKLVFSPFARPGSLLYRISSEAGVHGIEISQLESERLEGDVGEVDIEDGGAQDAIEGHNVPAPSSDFDLKFDDVEFSESELEELLSGQAIV
jgi:RecA/RadA recombinase